MSADLLFLSLFVGFMPILSAAAAAFHHSRGSKIKHRTSSGHVTLKGSRLTWNQRPFYAVYVYGSFQLLERRGETEGWEHKKKDYRSEVREGGDVMRRCTEARIQTVCPSFNPDMSRFNLLIAQKRPVPFSVRGG